MLKYNFFAREQYLDVLKKRITDLKDGYRQNIAIIGDELIGKTSIIHGLLREFYDNRIIIIYMETRPESLATFAHRFIGVLLYNFLINSNIALKEDIDFLILKSGKFIPRTIEKIKFILTALKKRKKGQIFSELLSLCDLINQETGKSCVVIFDEFHNLENIGIGNVYAEWSKLLITQKNTMYIIISSMKFKAKAILSKGLSLLFGNFQLLLVEPFDIKTTERYLDKKIHCLGLENGLRDFLIHFTGGHPFYLEAITDALLKSPDSNFADVLENLLFEPSGILHQRFSNSLRRFSEGTFSQDYISILHLVSCGRNRLKDIAQVLHKTTKEITARVNDLLESDTLSRSADFLKINDRVFGFWLRFVYQEKMHSLTFDANNQKVLFREKIDNMVREFIFSTHKPIIERMTQLMQLFEDDLAQIEKRKLRLSHFREIKPLEFKYKGLKDGLIGRSSDSLWIMAFKYESLTEDDIAQFSKECKKYRHKSQKKIIVGFGDIDANAHLRALEEKILAWDINNLNQVLDLFCQPMVIV